MPNYMRQKQVIWEQEEPVLSWDVSSMATEDGRFVVYVLLSEGELEIPQRSRALILRRFCGKSVKPCAVDTFDVPASDFESDEVELEGGKSPFLWILGPKLVFGTRTHIFNEFPKFFIALEKRGTKSNIYYQSRRSCKHSLLTDLLSGMAKVSFASLVKVFWTKTSIAPLSCEIPLLTLSLGPPTHLAMTFYQSLSSYEKIEKSGNPHGYLLRAYTYCSDAGHLRGFCRYKH
ncbi:hypothetical protein OG21DRAFT_1500000 [Imleria badia]|nr:hypothetical protein OG21DRAFT_1500000 [Imleria badia]